MKQAIVSMKNIWWICVLVVFLSLKFTKLHGRITRCQCQGTKGIWSPTTKSCFKYFNYRAPSREHALSFCFNTAPCGSRGRLAHIPNAQIFNHFKDCHWCLVGVIAIDGGTHEHFDPKEWVYQDQLRNGTSFTVPLLWHSDKPIANKNGACMEIYNRQFDDFDCGLPYRRPLCEYVSDKYTESTDSGDLGVKETCKQIKKGAWSAATHSCFKPYNATLFYWMPTWAQGHSFCMDTAPCGTRGRLGHFPSYPIGALVSSERPMWVGVVGSTKSENSSYNATGWVLYDEFPNGTKESKPLHVWLPNQNANAGNCMAISNGTYTRDKCHKKYGAVCEYLAYDRKTDNRRKIWSACEKYGEDSADKCKYCLIGKHTNQAVPVYSTYTPGSTNKPYSHKLNTSLSICGTTVRFMKNGVKDIYIANYKKTTAIQTLCGSDASNVILGRKTTAGQIEEKKIGVGLSTDIAMVQLNVNCNKGALSAQVTSLSPEMKKINHTDIDGDIFSIECV